MKALIISNGQLENIDFLKKKLPQVDYIIACDGGAVHLKRLGLKPDLILGDFDSLDHSILEYYKGLGVLVERFPVKKDRTDTHIAVDKAVELGADEVCLIGALGTRFDHSFANVMLLMYLARRGIRAEILDCHNRVRVYNESFILKGEPGQIVSLLPLSHNCVIESVKGLKYEIQDFPLPQDFPLGVSNEFSDSEASVKLKSGWVMVILARD